ncbi:polyprenyl synthetase family protein [Pseudoxanthobacter sp.]|uniref:polyprenyl synthetase family protein n=1 Tax=Pseudoxanthobacter sp. TaxID=1925742 RepID=UPI002FE00550
MTMPSPAPAERTPAGAAPGDTLAASLSPSLAASLAATAGASEAVLAALLAADDSAGPAAFVTPARLAAAMRHGVLGGGKRFRPFLLVESARLAATRAGTAPDDLEARALRAAAAIEVLHCYSLIHDDLPAMDDDDLRRGQPTVHRAFDEATAILAGDGLLTLAFEILSDPATDGDPAVRIALVSQLARAAGPAGMVGGQMLDLAAEHSVPDEAMVARIQAMKTGALITAACTMGATLGRAQADDLAALKRFGDVLGLAFQLADDLLDVDGGAEEVGKRTGKDASRGKATFVAVNGADWARTRLGALVAEAEALLAPFGPAAAVLQAAARFVAERRN